MKKASLIGLVLFCIMAGQAVGDAWWWPPTDGAMVAPQNPTSSNVVAITLSGEWHDCGIPNDSAIFVMGNDIYFDVILDYPGVLPVITPWERTESVGPLPRGTYTVYARLVGDPFVPEMYMPVAEFTVRDPIYYYVDCVDGNDSNDGLSPETAFATIQKGIDTSQDGDTVIVADGTYTGPGNRDIDFLGKAITVRSINPNDPNIVAATIINCQGTELENHRGFYFHSGEDENSVVEGLTITNGFNGRGGGILCIASSPIIRNNIITGNKIEYDADGGAGIGCWRGASPLIVGNTISDNHCEPGGGGGGIRCYEAGTPTITGNIISGNSASQGGGICINFCNPTVSNCTFSRNSAAGIGGGVLINSSIILTNCTFSGNTARSGAGMYNYQCSPTLTNCYFTGNSAEYRAGAILNTRGSSPTLRNCIFTGNIAGNIGGAIYNHGYTSINEPAVVNCTFADNSALHGNALACDSYLQKYPSDLQLINCILWDGDNQIWNNDGSAIAITYSDVQGGYEGEGNIDADPCFVNPDSNDFHLRPGSPCIDAGDNNSLPADTTDLDGDGDTNEPIPWDLGGNARIVDGNSDGNAVVDMGAYEAPVPPIEVAMKFTPGALNLGSKGKWVKAHCVLPEGYTVEDVDVNTSATLELLGIEAQSEYIDAFVNEDNLVEVEIGFERGAFCCVGTSDEFAEAVVTGSLTSGQRFQGTDTIKIINNKFTCIAVLASYWLEEDCGKPDWCGGADLDEDSMVNFRDFALFDGCCVEVITE